MSMKSQIRGLFQPADGRENNEIAAPLAQAKDAAKQKRKYAAIQYLPAEFLFSMDHGLWRRWLGKFRTTELYQNCADASIPASVFYDLDMRIIVCILSVYKEVVMVRMNIIMPELLVEHLKTVPNKSRYIAEALQEKIMRERTRSIRGLLAAAYTESADEDHAADRAWNGVLNDGDWKE